jgi:hypothetical protein
MSDKGGPIEYISNDAYKHQSITRCRRGRDLIVSLVQADIVCIVQYH